MNEHKIKVAVIGTGHLGSIHTRIYHELPECELVGVCDIDPKIARAMGKKYGVEWSSRYEDFFTKAEAVSIVVPTSMHYQVAKDFLMQGICVLVEKPITPTLEEADELLKIAAQKKGILQVGHVERFNAAVEFIQHFLKGPRFIDCQRLGPFSKRATDVGVVLDLMIHDIDIILAMANAPIKSIDAIGMHVLTNHEDIANTRIRFENGMVANISASRITKDTTRKIRLFAEDAYVSLDYIKQHAVICTKSNTKIKRKEINIKRQEPLKKELEAFIHCVKTKERPLVSGEEGRNALSVALEIQRQIKHYRKLH